MSRLELINGSCVDQNVDVIVNAANKDLYPGSGVCGAIYSKAGYDLLNNACMNIKTPLKDGDAVITPAFNISNTKYIIHAVGPNFGITPDAFDSLFNAYYNSLLLAKEHNLHSISFPLISSGIYGGNLDHPVQESTRECINAYKRFTEENDYDLTVLLCAFTKGEFEEANIVFTENLYDRRK